MARCIVQEIKKRLERLLFLSQIPDRSVSSTAVLGGVSKNRKLTVAKQGPGLITR